MRKPHKRLAVALLAAILLFFAVCEHYLLSITTGKDVTTACVIATWVGMLIGWFLVGPIYYGHRPYKD